MAENPLKIVLYHLANLPWYFIKFWDWVFTVITALLVFITK